MLTLFYSPHSTSVDNEAGRASGHADVPLSALGRQQAAELRKHYASEKIDAVFCSDLQRAVVTAKLLFGERGLPVTPDARLREFDYGEMTQYPREQVEGEFPQRITEPFPGGESASMAAQRVGTFLQDVAREYDGKTIVVIGHRATMYGIRYWCGTSTLEEIVNTPWEWRDIPIWRFEINPR
ncbi:hypothetical protein KSC_100010 [Ktedonobacter sp. SOSP1-52]|uniref:histidine phosphatase family protein n=1 Tax=Ktedonobacter sp. SOSP1-52 TaxID=2778366 RepID=UPI0019157876|nr:histidine phosphatase family protein [Ktedonobacter sp. SOSP1-52]GHO71109.1 hypothetical protein KSC_100010 [Ktedonobacter sp. SOSP1-52]